MNQKIYTFASAAVNPTTPVRRFFAFAFGTAGSVIKPSEPEFGVTAWNGIFFCLSY